MSLKVIAIGNILMGDDGIAISVLGLIEEKLKKHGFVSIIAETDFEYALSQISDNDTVFIIDAAVSTRDTGDVFAVPFCKLKGVKQTQHSLSIINYISIYYKNINGYLINIEAENIEEGAGISKELNCHINELQQKVFDLILKLS